MLYGSLHPLHDHCITGKSKQWAHSHASYISDNTGIYPRLIRLRSVFLWPPLHDPPISPPPLTPLTPFFHTQGPKRCLLFRQVAVTGPPSLLERKNCYSAGRCRRQSLTWLDQGQIDSYRSLQALILITWSTSGISGSVDW